jgi:hypothetical protein
MVTLMFCQNSLYEPYVNDLLTVLFTIWYKTIINLFYSDNRIYTFNQFLFTYLKLDAKLKLVQ